MTVVPTACASCGTPLLEEARFCHACGFPSVQSEVPAAECKQVTVLFTDVVHWMDIATAVGAASSAHPRFCGYPWSRQFQRRRVGDD